MRKFLFVMSCLMLVLAVTNPLQAQPNRKGSKKTGLKAVKEHLFYEEYEQAIPQLEQLLQSEPSNAYYNYWMGKCLYITYKKNSALSYFEKAAAVNADVDKEFHWFYALTLHYNNRYDQAIQEYKKDMERYQPESEQYRENSNRIAQCMTAAKMRQRKEGDLVKITNLGANINTAFAEHSPVISSNDSVLLFTARRPECLGANPEISFYDEDIYVSYNQGGKWSEARNIDLPVNSKGHDATISLSADGKVLYLYRHKKAGGLYVTDYDTLARKWKEPKAIEKPLNSKYYETTICQSASGDKLFFTSDRPGGFGGKDLYMVTKSGNDWSEPKNLGPTINSSFDEDAPYFHPDGKTLYFSSNGPQSVGGYDIFVTEWDSNSDSWLEPLNMGMPVNTGDDDIYFVINQTGLTGYYSSGKEGGYGEKDIYRIDFPYYRYPKRYYAVEVLGIVQDVQTLDTLDAMVRLVDKASGLVVDSIMTDPQTKQYFFELESGKAYSIEAISQGYDTNYEDINAPLAIDDDISMVKDVKVLQPKIPPPVITKIEKEIPEIQHIYYDFDKDALRKEAKLELDRIAQMMKEDPMLKLDILAHTDWFGTFNYNVDLSNRRSIAAYNYLLSKGIPADKMRRTWFSENTPIETNENDDGRQYNRRSEFRLYRSGQLYIASVKLRAGQEAPWVDHAKPKGLPGFDNPRGTVSHEMSDAAGPSHEEPTLEMVAANNQRMNVKPDSDSRLDVKGPDTRLNVSGNTEFAALPPASAGTDDGLRLSNIYFDYNRFALREESVRMLDFIAQVLALNPDYKLEIKGHTDGDGTSDYNQTLSEQRCLSAYNYLAGGHNISEQQLFMNSFSENKPIADNQSEAGKQLNRRVEFVIKKGDQVVMFSQK